MASNEETMEVEDSNGYLYGNKVKLRLKDPSKFRPKRSCPKQAVKIAKQAEEHERFINKVTHLLGVLGFGGFCFIWAQDFCYYANTIFLIMLLCYPRNEKLFMVCFSFAEGPLAWALIIWRCSLVFNSMDKIVSVFIHLLPGLVFFTIRWWDPVFFEAMHPEGTASRASWPYVESKPYLWTWLFAVPLVAYLIWQFLYFLIVNVLRRQRLLRDPEVMTSYRLCSPWQQRHLLSRYSCPNELHVTFQVLKVSATVWNGGNFLLEVMPRQVILKEKKKTEVPIIEAQIDQSGSRKLDQIG
ncbi:uncharacterized membrane protein ygr149w [Phtheirospermum japonicum]|uniref:Glycerophosphocholine acyltransferase 1 n=1 Tax=Phtheirospermum japonicum TaxID=374723 RepID=A0A830B4F0_9LAMI|nr:uncharacterized membrane protein ygr149w [Phtheirospermum japonicum]